MSAPIQTDAVAGPHIFRVRVYYEDTDFSGRVYHASYLRFLERGRTEMLRDMGIHQGAAQSDPEGAWYFVVARMTIDYLRPAGMDDVLEIETLVKEAGGASLILKQRVKCGEKLLVSADVRIAMVHKGKAQRFPAGLKQKFAGYIGSSDDPVRHSVT